MTLAQCIQRCDALRPNSASESEKARWVLEIEGELVENFFPRYAPPPPVADPPRCWPEDKTKTLSASGPFEGLYLYRLMAWLDLMDQETAGWNLHTQVANTLESDFKKNYHRTHRRGEATA